MTRGKKAALSIFLGLAGLAGSFHSLNYSLPPFSISIDWCIFLPLLAAMAYGGRYGLLAGTVGLGALYPFILWPNNGWACLVTSILDLSWLAGLGFFIRLRKRRPAIWNHPQLVYLLAVMLFSGAVWILFPIAFSFNPPFWNKRAELSMPISVLDGIVAKGAFIMYMTILFNDCLLNMPFIRKFLGLEIKKEARNNTRIAAGIILGSILIWYLFVLFDRILTGQTISQDLFHHTNPHETVALLVFLASGIFIVSIVTHYEESRLKALDELYESERKTRAIFDLSFGFIGLLTPDGKVVDINRSALEFAQVPKSEVVGKPFWETPWWAHSAELQEILRGAIRVAAAGEMIRLEANLHGEHEAPYIIDFSLKPVKDENGRVVLLIPEGRDITERKRAEEALKESEYFFKESQRSASIGSYKADLVGDSWESSEVLDHIFGIDKTYKRTIQGWLDIVHPDERENLKKYLNEEVISKRKFFSREYRIICKNSGETRWVNGLGEVKFDANGRGILLFGTIQDITERKLMEEKLLRTERIESIGTLAAGVAHDLNNILAPILMSAEILQSIDDPVTRKSLISSIEASAKRGANIVKRVLTFARGSGGERIPLQLHRIVEDMEKVVRETFPTNITITTSVPRDLRMIQGDTTQLHQVLLNLCINARDAMGGQGGTLQLSGSNVEIDENFAAMVPYAKVGTYVMLAISDTGTGIPQKILGKIFDPFFTTKSVEKGTGLGLSTVLGIVRSHGGFITVDSDEGRGTTFKVFLPVNTGAQVESRSPSPKGILQGRGETILVVDDEENVAKTTSLVLGKNGYQVLTATSGEEALALYKEHVGEIKIVITDVMMPDVNGVQLSRALKEINPQLKIIASTGHATEAHQNQLRALGIHVILSKPYDAKKLLDTLHAATGADAV